MAWVFEIRDSNNAVAGTGNGFATHYPSSRDLIAAKVPPPIPRWNNGGFFCCYCHPLTNVLTRPDPLSDLI
jgi:hypothetical protein